LPFLSYMHFFERLLLVLTAVLALLVGVLLVLQIRGGNGVEKTPSGSVPAQSALEHLTASSPFPALLPSLRGERSLVAVVIENHEDARPHQRGLDRAVLVQEYLVEGLITRFVAFFDTHDLPAIVGPVRSLRSYFLDGVLPYTSFILHAGGSPGALERVEQNHSVHNFNGLYYPDHFLRANEIPAPHDLFITRDSATDLLSSLRVDPVAWPPYQTGNERGGEKTGDIRVNFFNPLHDTIYAYNLVTHNYTRTNGGIVSDAKPSNVLILEAPINGEGEYGRLDIRLHGEGRMLLFRDGKVFEGRWRKEGPEKPFTFTNQNNRSITFSRGQTWMMILHTLERVSWEEEIEN